jgi:hypothetical protein
MVMQMLKQAFLMMLKAAQMMRKPALTKKRKAGVSMLKRALPPRSRPWGKRSQHLTPGPSVGACMRRRARRRRRSFAMIPCGAGPPGLQLL